MKTGGVLGWVLPLASLLAADAVLRSAELRVTGSDLLGPDFASAVRQFAERSEQELRLSLDGSRRSLARLRNGDADVGLVVVRPGQPLPAGPFASFAFAYHAVYVLVPAALPLTQITVPDLAAIYGAAAGASHATWGELGLTGEWTVRAMEPQAMAAGRGLSLEIFRELALHGGELKTVVVLQATEEALLNKLSAGETGIALAPSAPKGKAAAVKVLPVAMTSRDIAYAPTPERVHAGDYALRLPVWLVVRRETARANLQFLQFLLSDEIATKLGNAALVPLPAQVREELRFELERL